MASSVGGFRLQREGYQPPSLPQQPPPPVPAAPSRQDRRSRSPTKRRDVPPPAPSPPTHSSRTSPPRPHSRRDLLSPRHESAPPPAPAESVAMPSQWLFTANEVKSSPSILDGVSPAEERLRRAKGVNFIYQAGVLLDLPQITLWVAGVFFHRFFMRYSMVEEKGGVHHYNIAATALFLANKTEENCRKTKDIIITVAKVAQKNRKLIIDEQSKEYWRWRDSILMYEELMLELLTFDLMVENPYHSLFDLLGQLGIVHNKHVRQSAWAFCNDCCLTSLPLLMDARDVAISAIFFSSVHTNQQIDDVNGEPWWKFLKGDESKCTAAINLLTAFWEENPLKKQNPAISSPAFQLDSTRRRGDTMLSQTETLSSAAPTPLDLDRGTQSPKGRANGATERDEGTKESSSKTRDFDSSQQGELSQKEPRSPSGHESAVSSLKRKDADAPAEGRAQKKKQRLSESDGGEENEA